MGRAPGPAQAIVSKRRISVQNQRRWEGDLRRLALSHVTVFSQRSDVVVALRELTRRFREWDSFAAEDADRCRNRRHISSYASLSAFPEVDGFR
jgi:hypothetical protein